MTFAQLPIRSSWFFALGSLLRRSGHSCCAIHRCDLSHPGAFYWTKPISLDSQKPHYAGKIVIWWTRLRCEPSEIPAMALGWRSGALVVGSQRPGPMATFHLCIAWRSANMVRYWSVYPNNLLTQPQWHCAELK